MRTMRLLYILAASSLSLAACTKNASEPQKPLTPEEIKIQLALEGKTIYQVQCTACHNPDPKKPGSLGPDVWGSSLELITSRVMKAEYPAGYKPKRDTHIMAKLPHLQNKLDALHAYLNQNY